MEIQIVIDTFKNVLKDYKLAYKNKEIYKNKNIYIDYFICNHAFYTYKIDLKSLFISTGYYKNYIGKNYINIAALKIPSYANKNRESRLKWKISFLKKEINSLSKLQKKGYTHI